ncbi:LOW QUALITY PROTEIN: hypothetical protein U0070_001999 [Myodes glareolus]|uniref:Uncharacterized protein n=1 Tax=Myodes glareolus TaxID=447135 RepID=A0AAW0J8U0_MYOGA
MGLMFWVKSEESCGLNRWQWQTQIRFAHEASYLDPRQSVPAVEGSILVTDQGKRKSDRGCIVDANLSVFNLERRIILDWQITLHLGSWGPKELTESESFSVFKDLKQRRRGTQDQSAQESMSCYSTCSATHMMMKGTGKQHAKENEEVAEYTKLLTERMKKAKEKCRET